MRVCSTPNELTTIIGSVPGPNFNIPSIFDLSHHLLGQYVCDAVDEIHCSLSKRCTLFSVSLIR